MCEDKNSKDYDVSGSTVHPYTVTTPPCLETNMALIEDLDVALNVAFAVVTIILLYIVLQRVSKAGKVSSSHGTRRVLSVFENAFNLWYQERQGSGILCLVLALKSKRKLLKEHVEDALILVAKRQPMLRAVISKSQRGFFSNEDNHCFEIIDGGKVPELLDITASQVNAKDWSEMWYDIAMKPFSTLSWRVILLKEEYISSTKTYVNTLVFTFNHGCVDGVSSIKFAKQFLENLNVVVEKSAASNESFSMEDNTILNPYQNSTRTSNSTPNSDPKQLPLHSDVTALLKNGKRSVLQFLWDYSGLSFVLRVVFKQKLRRVFANKQSNPFFVKFPPKPVSSCPFPAAKLMHNVYTKSETSEIVDACKLNNCTVTGALAATAHLAFCRILKDEVTPGENVKLEHGFAINTKRYCRPVPHKEYLGLFALTSGITLGFVETEHDFWELARECTKQIHRSLKDEKYIDEHISIYDSFNCKELLDEIWSPRKQADLTRISFCNGISSAGSFKFNEELTDPTYEVDYCMYWNLVHEASGVLFYYNVTVNGRMSWVIAYAPSKIPEREAERLSVWCFEHLLSFSQNN